jgi:hypothetical protein
VATLLHDPTVRESIRARLQNLRPDSKRKWGKMSADQMLWHVNQALGDALGDAKPADMKPPIPAPLLKFVIMNLPWPKGAPTFPEFVAGDQYSFDAERHRCFNLIDRFAVRSMDDPAWGRSAVMGKMSGRDWSHLLAKHLDHHLKQFSQ